MAMRDATTYKATEVTCNKKGIEISLKEEYKVLKYYLHEHNYGGKRRKMIYEILASGVEFPVNCRHTIQTKNDPDIQKLLKQGKIEMFNNSTGLKSKRTYLRVKNG